MGKRGPKISDTIEREIALIYRRGALKAPKVLVALKENHKNDNSFRLPGRRATEIRLKFMKDVESRLKKEKLNPDRPWSLGISHDFGIPSEANAQLLKIWWFTVLTGTPLTIREARWYYRIGSAEFPAAAYPFYLLFEARRYAEREWLADITGQPIYTSDLDAHLVEGLSKEIEVDWWSIDTAIELGYIHAHPEDVPRSPLPYRYPSDQVDQLMEYNVQFKGKTQFFSLVERKQLPNRALSIYALWLQKISTAPMWQTLSAREQASIIEQLRESVAHEVQRQEKERRYFRGADELWKPTKILRKLDLFD